MICHRARTPDAAGRFAGVADAGVGSRCRIIFVARVLPELGRVGCQRGKPKREKDRGIREAHAHGPSYAEQHNTRRARRRFRLTQPAFGTLRPKDAATSITIDNLLPARNLFHTNRTFGAKFVKKSTIESSFSRFGAGYLTLSRNRGILRRRHHQQNARRRCADLELRSREYLRLLRARGRGQADDVSPPARSPSRRE